MRRQPYGPVRWKVALVEVRMVNQDMETGKSASDRSEKAARCNGLCLRKKG